MILVGSPTSCSVAAGSGSSVHGMRGSFCRVLGAVHTARVTVSLSSALSVRSGPSGQVFWRWSRLLPSWGWLNGYLNRRSWPYPTMRSSRRRWAANGAASTSNLSTLPREVDVEKIIGLLAPMRAAARQRTAYLLKVAGDFEGALRVVDVYSPRSTAWFGPRQQGGRYDSLTNVNDTALHRYLSVGSGS